jgi:hypothetical protein
MKYEQIRDSIKESSRRIFWYDSKGKLLVVDSSKSSSRKKLLKTKYEGLLYRLSITFHKEGKFGQGGPLAVRCAKFNLEDGTIQKIKDKQSGIVWFDKDYLETRRKWNDNWLNIIIIRLLEGFKFGFGIDMYPI